MQLRMKPTGADLRAMRKESLRWPETLAKVPIGQWPPDPFSSGTVRVDLLRSRTFIVQVFVEKGFTRLSVNRADWDERQNRFREDITWDDLQRIKREAGYGDMCAVELFPPDDEVVNVANMRHLWLVPSPIFMWRDKD